MNNQNIHDVISNFYVAINRNQFLSSIKSSYMANFISTPYLVTWVLVKNDYFSSFLIISQQKYNFVFKLAIRKNSLVELIMDLLRINLRYVV